VKFVSPFLGHTGLLSSPKGAPRDPKSVNELFGYFVGLGVHCTTDTLGVRAGESDHRQLNQTTVGKDWDFCAVDGKATFKKGGSI
jgi:hypothetical protein